jgi:hypothetical protein
MTDCGLTIPTSKRSFSLTQCEDSCWACPGLYPMSGSSSFPRDEAYHLLSSNSEVKIAWSYVFISPYVLMMWCLIEHKHNFSFTVLLSSAGKFGSHAELNLHDVHCYIQTSKIWLVPQARVLSAHPKGNFWSYYIMIIYCIFFLV